MSPPVRASQRALLRTEAAAAHALHRAAGQALADAGKRPATQAHALRDALTPAIVVQRLAARQAGHRALAGELVALSPRAGAALGPEPDEPTLSDRLAAERAADLFAAAWLTRAQRDGANVATEATRYRLDALAGGETAHAFGAERERALDELPRVGSDGWDGLPLIGKRWDAYLDACALCRRLADTVRPLGMDYPGGWVPGYRHRRCRCLSSVVLLPLAWRTRSTLPSAEAFAGAGPLL